MKDFEYKKSLGQNFLIDKNILATISSSIELKENSLIIEIGPGSGNLTKELLKLNTNVICFEIDTRLKVELDKIENENLEIYYEDFLKSDLKGILSNYKYENLYVIANIPYYITTPIIKKLYNETNVYQMTLMVQKEVGNRFVAVPNTKEYNSLSIFLQYNFNISKVCTVSKNSFFPKPKVDSVVIKFTRKDNKLEVKDEQLFYKLVRDSFQFKRKTLRNNLKSYNLEVIEKTLQKHNKNLTARAESLSIEEFADISNNI